MRPRTYAGAGEFRSHKVARYAGRGAKRRRLRPKANPKPSVGSSSSDDASDDERRGKPARIRNGRTSKARRLAVCFQTRLRLVPNRRLPVQRMAVRLPSGGARQQTAGQLLLMSQAKPCAWRILPQGINTVRDYIQPNNPFQKGRRAAGKPGHRHELTAESY